MENFKQKQYQVYIRKWISFCDQREINRVHSSVALGLAFLVELYEQGLGYSSLNTARSEISSFILLGNEHILRFGSHPLVIRFMKAFVKAVFISLKDLTLKLVMLFALVATARVQTFTYLIWILCTSIRIVTCLIKKNLLSSQGLDTIIQM